MIKHQEFTMSTSCLNKAEDDEPIFVLRAKDPLASAAVSCWAAMATSSGAHEEWKIKEALELASQMRVWRIGRKL